MKKIIEKISGALLVLLLAPIKLPGKGLHVIEYIALDLGVVETLLEDKDKKMERRSLRHYSRSC